MTRRTLMVFMAAVFGFCTLHGQWKTGAPEFGSAQQLTGSLALDLGMAATQDSGTGSGTSLADDGMRSPLKAALFSAAVPGAGQYYNDSYWKAGAFLALEIAAWVVYFSNDSKGDQQTTVFQAYADQHWSVAQYVDWIGREFSDADISNILQAGYDPNRPWDFVNWDKLNQVEEFIAQKATSGITTGFTHRLPRRPEQQYFELIGKYPQFLGGWDDGYFKGKGDILTGSVSQNFSDYSLMRGKANDYYTVAQGVSIAILANHLVSAFEAAWEASRINRNIRLKSQSTVIPSLRNGSTLAHRLTLEYTF